jgi:chemotaxis protein histidine kinase CheA
LPQFRPRAPVEDEESATERDEAATPSRGAHEPREMVRVSAGLLEQLVNLAGESSIIRSRVEQGMNDFSTSLERMEITIERVREQLRRLEIETETQCCSDTRSIRDRTTRIRSARDGSLLSASSNCRGRCRKAHPTCWI